MNLVDRIKEILSMVVENKIELLENLCLEVDTCAFDEGFHDGYARGVQESVDTSQRRPKRKTFHKHLH